ncbi:MAG: purine-nucleoside phosphorylase [Planctomycetes bacterium]|nr:purine-nucleoside phosphorylase [Planctomycetota bacterium]
MSDGAETARLDAAVAALEPLGLRDCRLALVLGSGLKGFAGRLTEAREVAFADVPGWPAPRVEGHGGALVVGRCGGVRVACLTGRVHLYEGWSPTEVVRAVRTLRRAGIDTFLLTNAAGGIRPTLRAGDLLVIEDHLNLTGSSPLVGPAEPALGPRFPDQSTVWDAALTELLAVRDPGLQRGVYAGLLGPSYETPAEVRMLAACGAAAVGMSTVHEAIALNAMGARLVGLSLISNQAAGLSGTRLSHDEVIAAGRSAAARLEGLVAGFCRALADRGAQDRWSAGRGTGD